MLSSTRTIHIAGQHSIVAAQKALIRHDRTLEQKRVLRAHLTSFQLLKRLFHALNERQNGAIWSHLEHLLHKLTAFTSVI